MSLRIPVNVQADISARELARGGMATREDLIEFVKDLDAEMQEWDFTLALCDHFAKLKLEHEREEAEDRARAAQCKP